MTLGFIGFGEAACHITKGLRAAGHAPVVAWDIHAETPGKGEMIRARGGKRDAPGKFQSGPGGAVRLNYFRSHGQPGAGCFAGDRALPRPVPSVCGRELCGEAAPAFRSHMQPSA